MELRDWAIQILTSSSLEDKLDTPITLTDHFPGKPLLFPEPARSSGMRFQKHHRKNKLPPLCELSNADKRAVCLHRFAGHELLAVEIMAHAIVAFPEAPATFRKGVAHTLKEEQQHVRLYMERLKGLGVQFGDLPLYRHFWSYVPHLTTPLKYVSMMSLTFEMANLDFAPYYGDAFRSHGDALSEKLMQTIFQDEIRHVSFGCQWLKRLKDKNQSTWDTWIQNLAPRTTPQRAKGPQYYPEHRIMAGVEPEWIEKLKHY
jgi:uncharacterized ferritin-like protein (DUF455 family)